MSETFRDYQDSARFSSLSGGKSSRKSYRPGMAKSMTVFERGTDKFAYSNGFKDFLETEKITRIGFFDHKKNLKEIQKTRVTTSTIE